MYITNLDDKNSKGTHWVSLFIDRNTAVYFDSFGIEYIPLKVLNKIRDKSITHNTFKYRIMNLLWVDFIVSPSEKYILAGKTLLDYANLFSPNYSKKNDKIIYKYFKDKYDRRSKSKKSLD